MRHPIFDWLMPVFDGFPYLVVRIAQTGMLDHTVLPADWPRERLIELAQRQSAANQLPVAACFGPVDAVYANRLRGATESPLLPSGIPIVERLILSESIPDSPEVVARRARLTEFGASSRQQGFFVGDGLEAGRLASPSDIKRLWTKVPDEAGVPRPPGLNRCSDCGDYRGQYLALRGEGNDDLRPRVLAVRCRCENRNRCARCGEPLAERRLSSYEYEEKADKVWYWAAYIGLSHQCEAVGEAQLA